VGGGREVAVGPAGDRQRLPLVGQQHVGDGQELVQAALGLDDRVEDIMLTLGKQYHVIRFLGPGQEVFVHLILDRERASLGMARQQLAKLARQRLP